MKTTRDAKLESDLQETLWTVAESDIDFNAGKTELVLFDQPGAIDPKIDGSVYPEKSSFKMLGLSFS